MATVTATKETPIDLTPTTTTQPVVPEGERITSKQAKNKLKFPAADLASTSLLRLVIGNTAYSIPVKAAIIHNGTETSAPTEGYLSVSQFADMVEIDPITHHVSEMDTTTDCTALVAALMPKTTRAKGAKSAPRLDDTVMAQLDAAMKAAAAQIPAGYKMGVDPVTGQPRLIKIRQRAA